MGWKEIQKLKEEAQKPKEPKQRKPLPKQKRPLQRNAPIKKESKKPTQGGAGLNRWFQERRLEMKGVCMNCPKRSLRNDDLNYKFSVAHILPKRPSMFPSVATHPDNWIELCWDCHTNMDSGHLDLIDMNCWDQIVTKFQKLYPLLTREEKARVPDILLQYLNTDQ